MASIRIERTIEAPAEMVWDALRDVGALHVRVAPGFVLDTQMEEGARIVTFHNGMVAREVIIDVSDDERRIAYGISGAPFLHHSASNQVFSEGTNRTRFVWIADLLPDALAPQISGMMNDGADALRTAMETLVRQDQAGMAHEV